MCSTLPDRHLAWYDVSATTCTGHELAVPGLADPWSPGLRKVFAPAYDVVFACVMVWYAILTNVLALCVALRGAASRSIVLCLLWSVVMCCVKWCYVVICNFKPCFRAVLCCVLVRCTVLRCGLLCCFLILYVGSCNGALCSFKRFRLICDTCVMLSLDLCGLTCIWCSIVRYDMA